MKLLAYSVFDMKVGAYLAPFFLRGDGEALRVFGDLANDPEHNFGRHPEDYTLYRVASFDDALGVLEPMRHQVLAKAVELVRVQPLPLFDRPSATLEPRDRFEQECG